MVPLINMCVSSASSFYHVMWLDQEDKGKNDTSILQQVELLIQCEGRWKCTFNTQSKTFSF